jgi:hypothetical protein
MSHTISHTIAGAADCFAIVQRLDQLLAGDETQTAAEYFAQQDAALAAFVEVAGPMPARAEGALRALAEILITTTQQGGGLEYGAFRPEAAMTPGEVAAKRQEYFDAEVMELRREASNVVPFRR